ncbi:MAG: DUF962 domain-containing protein [Candidatus Dormibacteria bacterium]
MLELTPVTEGTTPPPKSAPFEDKMAYYRSQHTTRGIRATHLVGIPAVAAALPLMVGRPRVGIPLFLGGWTLQVIGHKVFEKNNPALTKGFLTYQFCGLAFWCEEMADIVAGRSSVLVQDHDDELESAVAGIPVGVGAGV